MPGESLHVGRLRDPKRLARGAGADLPSLLQWVDFSPRCEPRNLQRGWNWETAGVGMWSLPGLGGLEALWGFRELQSQGRSGYGDVPIEQEWTIPLSFPV